MALTGTLLRRRLSAPLVAAGAILLFSGHIGSPNVFFEGFAGAYPVHVVVQIPPIVPGLAEISIRVTGTPKRVLVRPVYSMTGVQGAPPADEARPVPGAPGLYSAQLWLMQRGAYDVHVTVEGPAGGGVALVPVLAVASRRLPMQPFLGWLLAALGIFLVVGLVWIVGAAVREAVLPPGQSPDRRRRVRAGFAMGVASLVIALVLLGGWKWWGLEDTFYRRGMVHRLSVRSRVDTGSAGRTLAFTVTDRDWLSRGEPRPDGSVPRLYELVPEHGKLVHMFLVRLPARDVFAHVHPLRLDSVDFRVALPPVPGGRYAYFADVLSEFGAAITLIDTVQVPAPGPVAAAAGDADDAWTASVAGTDLARLDDGGTMGWRHGALRAGADAQLRFQVLDPAGRPAALEPYLGMAGHAVILRDDDSVFAHLHPMGSFATAAPAVIEGAGAPAQAAAAPMPMPVRADGTVSFPYEFPSRGHYHVWVQVRRAGRVQTGSFVTEVGSAAK